MATMLHSRRKFLAQAATLVAAGWAVPSFIAETARIFESGASLTPTAHAAGRKILVIIQLAGGNDGLNTVVPYGNPTYYAPNVRPNIAIPANQVLPLSGAVGLHPSLTNMKARYDRGQVAVVQGVSYPNPNRSHFRGTDIWESAIPNRLEATGWMGRYLENCGCQSDTYPAAMTVGSSQSAGSFWTEMSLVPAVASISNFRYTSVNGSTSPSNQQRNNELATLRTALAQSEGTPQGELLRKSILTALDESDLLARTAAGQTPRGTYPANSFGNSMKLITQLVLGDVGTSIFYVSLGGFDTHSAQTGTHANLMTTLDQAIEGFLDDMELAGRLGDVTLMTFSEFGRRLAENGSTGTDHGVAAPMFVIGGGVAGGLHGAYPSLTDLTSGDLKMQVDFRQVYSAVLENWLNIPSNGILEGTFAPLPLFVPPVNCTPRPPAHVATSVSGGRLNVAVQAGGGMIREIRFGPTRNAKVDVGALTGQAGSFSYRPPTPGGQITFSVARDGAATVHVPFVLVDDCGEWTSFVGGGSTAGF